MKISVECVNDLKIMHQDDHASMLDIEILQKNP